MTEGRIAVLCRPQTAGGFQLAGLPPTEARDGFEASRLLPSLLSDADLGILLIEQRLYERLADTERRRISSRALPLVIPFPSPTWSERALVPDTYLVELLRRAIGYQVRLR